MERRGQQGPGPRNGRCGQVVHRGHPPPPPPPRARAPGGLGRPDPALLQRAAVALLAGEGEAPTDAFLANIGLSDFGVRQTGEGAEHTTTVSLGKQLSRRWYLGYERSVNATVGTWQLIYRIAQRFTLRAQSGEDSALDLIWTWRWD